MPKERVPTMIAQLQGYMLRHPRSIGETYGEHFQAAIATGGDVMLAGAACIVHAVLPCSFETTASDCIARLHGRLQSRRRRRILQFAPLSDYQI